MNGRRGYSLIETVAMMGAGAAMMAIAVGVLHMLMRLEQVSRDEVRQRVAVDRLADQFRRDVHAADRFTPVDATEGEDSRPAWQLALEAGHAVEYRAEQKELLRTERAEGEVVKLESFSLPARATVSIDLVGEAAPGIVSLQIARDGSQAPGPIWRRFNVEAALAKDRRFWEQKEP